MLNTRSPSAAFTLIELMIAMVLGMVIVGVAMAGFRTSVQAATISNRLSTENALIRARA